MRINLKSKEIHSLKRVFIVTMLLTLVCSNVNAKETVSDKYRILSYEKTNPVYEIEVEKGTKLKDIELPASLTVVVNQEIVDSNESFVQQIPNKEKVEYLVKHNYQSIDGKALQEQPTIYSKVETDGTVTYRIYGTYQNEEAFYACTQDGEIIGIVKEIPVVWQGTYNNEQEGTYYLNAENTEYFFEEKPRIKITVIDKRETRESLTQRNERGIGAKYGDYTITHLVSNTVDTTITSSGGIYEVSGSSNRAIFVNGSAEIVLVLVGVSRVQGVSRLQVNDTAKVTIYLVENTVNTFDSRGGTTPVANGKYAGIYVGPNASLTITGSGTLNSYGGAGCAGIGGIMTTTGIYVRSGKVIIEEGKITAMAGPSGAAGIGGGRHNSNGTVIINGGTINAYGSSSNGGSGIGGGGGTTNSLGLGGNITINGGDITARAYGSSAGIGGGFNSNAERITITGGNIHSQTSGAGSGIGAGGGSHCGVINISGGNIFAKGSNQAAGIGNGLGVNGGTINISGGIIHAESANAVASGVGGGGSGRANINITGGSVFSITPSGNIRINYDPKNSVDYGSVNVYMIAVKLIDERNNIQPDSEISIYVNAGNGITKDYVYQATTNSKGIAYMWLPNGTYNYLLYNPTNGTYFDSSITVAVPSNTAEYDPETNTGVIVLSNAHPFWNLSSGLSLNLKTYGNSALTLSILHDNFGNHPNKAIVGVKWFLESVENPLYLQENFDEAYAQASQDNKGVSGDRDGLALLYSNGANNHYYLMNIKRNGRYWFQIHYRGANTGLDIYHATYIDIDNIYNPLNIYVQDWDKDSNTQLKPYSMLSPGKTYGLPLDYDGSLINNPRLGYDRLSYQRNPILAPEAWQMYVPTPPFDTTEVTDLSADLPLAAAVVANLGEDNTVSSNQTNKYYTVNYKMNLSFNGVVVTEKHVDTNGKTLININDTVEVMKTNDIYDKSIPEVPGYLSLGHRWSSNISETDNHYSKGNPYKEIEQDETIYFIYKVDLGKADIRISNTTTGKYADINKRFEYTVYFIDDKNKELEAGLSFNYQGSVLDNQGQVEIPHDGVLVLDEDGKASLELSHGQQIKILAVPVGIKIRVVVEISDNQYTTSIVDSKDGTIVDQSTGDKEVLPGGRSFAFTNDRLIPPLTGIDAGYNGSLILVLLTILLVVIFMINRKVRQRLVREREK